MQIGLGKEEFFLINLTIKLLTQKYPLVSAVFWGKVFGTRANYIIAEAEFQEGEGEDDDEEDTNGEEPNKEDSAMSNEVDEEEGSDIHRDEPPKSQWKPPPIIPKEEPKTGVNKKTYFVCNIRKANNIDTSYQSRHLFWIVLFNCQMVVHI